MTEVIVLGPDESEKVRGYSSTKEGAALVPIPLKDGRFYLGQEVLDDPAHQDVRPFLGALPLVPLEKLPVYTEEDAEQPAAIEATKLSARVGIIDALGVKSLPENEKTQGVARV